MLAKKFTDSTQSAWRVTKLFGKNRVILKSLLLSAMLFGCSAPEIPKETVEVATRLGVVEGFRQHEVMHFYGIPYAAPPVGEKRFMAPSPPEAWSGVLAATSYANRCLQAEGGLEGEGTPFKEDCLYLNIYTPSVNGEKRPVLFWIHGGGFTQGSANGYDGSVLAGQGDVVVVTINYRLGLLGFADLLDLGRHVLNCGCRLCSKGDTGKPWRAAGFIALIWSQRLLSEGKTWCNTWGRNPLYVQFVCKVR